MGYINRFIKECIKRDKNGFMSSTSLLREQENYIFLNVILNKYDNFPFVEWKKNTFKMRKEYMEDVFGPSIFSLEHLNYGWYGYSLYHAEKKKRHIKVKPKRDLRYLVGYVVWRYDLINKKVLKAKKYFDKEYHSTKKLTMDKFEKYVKTWYDISNGIIMVKV